MLDNMIEKNRTRRGIIKKLKELGLIFKAPTRKSVAATVSKHAWFHEQDIRLRELYDEHRLDDGKAYIALRNFLFYRNLHFLYVWLICVDCLTRIMEEFSDTRTRNAVIKRMLELALIADRSEVMPSKRRKSKKSAGGREDNHSEGDDDDDDDGDQSGDGSDSDEEEAPRAKIKVTVKNVKGKKQAVAAKPVKRSAPKIAMDVTEVQRLMATLNDDDKENLEWLQESLNDAAEDAEDASEDPDDGVPLVPFTAKQREAFENDVFIDLLKALGIQEPVKDMVSELKQCSLT